MKIKLSEIYKIIDEEIQKLNEGYPLEIHVKDKLKVDKILKSLKIELFFDNSNDHLIISILSSSIFPSDDVCNKFASVLNGGSPILSFVT